MQTPAADGYRMPAEWAPHRRCWIVWPHRTETWGAAHLDAARVAAIEVARTVALFEPVALIAPPTQAQAQAVAARLGDLSDRHKIEVIGIDSDDSWARDIGPTFLVGDAGRMTGVHWKFNGWGGKTPHAKDAQVARRILAQAGVSSVAGPLVLEGGAITVDGAGTAIVVEPTVLDSNRNPGIEKAAVEHILAEYLGVEKVVWLAAGLIDDDTDGHVDNVAAFVGPAAVVVAATRDTADPNYHLLLDAKARLEAAADAQGRVLRVFEMPLPQRVEYGETGKRLPLSYINAYQANGGLVMPEFDDPKDMEALSIYRRLLPDQTVATVNALPIVRGGGGIHCITQQEPDPTPPPAPPAFIAAPGLEDDG